MIVTKIEPVTKTRFKVYVDEQFAFVLYKGELSRYKIREEKEISQDTINEIQTEVLTKRVKLRAMHILTRMDRTEEQLRTKLKQDLYTEELIEIAVNYVASFGYIGDEDYTRRFISSKQNSKSKREIMMKLQQKGVSKEIVQEVFEECYDDEKELDAIRRLVEKKHFDAENASNQEKKRMYDYLLRKGFRYEDIRQVLQVSSWNA